MTPTHQASGYIYVRNWEKRQHHRYDSPPWHKVYNETLRDDDYLRLSLTDRGLLQDLWTLASLAGDGRVSADRTFLARQLNVRRVSLEPLIQAGFIEVLDTKRIRNGTETVLESKRESREDPLTPVNGGTQNRQTRAERQEAERVERRLRAVSACRRVWNLGIADGDKPEALRESLDREYRHDPSIVSEAIGGTAA